MESGANLNIVKIGGEESVNHGSEARCINCIIVCDHECGSVVTFLHLIIVGMLITLWVGEETLNLNCRERYGL
jgi:hypothetical protein